MALGASAGGLESLGRVLAGLPKDFAAPVLVALHLDPHRPSQAVPLLQRRTHLRVKQAVGGSIAEPGHVYVAPPDSHLELRAGRIHLTHAARVNFSRPSIDVLFASVAAAVGPRAVVAVLSGTGTDGSAGLAAVKSRGGVAVVEDDSTAAFAGMPHAAARSGLPDAVLPVQQIAPFLMRSLERRVTISARQWQQAIDLLEARTGTTFSRYRSATLQRRLQHRVAATGAASMSEYLRTLRHDPAELDRLQAAFLIKVSSFLRNPGTWTRLARELVPATGRRPFRAWSAGCATGEEAYTLAMVLARRFGTGRRAAWKVFATDVDEGALKFARQGLYARDRIQAVPRADLDRYFLREGHHWRVRRELRSRVVFGRNDLLRDTPLSDMDVVSCRNVLIYFTAAVKTETLARLARSVRPGGLLVLGRSEGSMRVPGFDRVGATTLFLRTPLPQAMSVRQNRAKNQAPKGAAAGLLDSATVVCIGIDGKGAVTLWNRAAQRFFGPTAAKATGKALATAVGAETARQLKATIQAGQTCLVECRTPSGGQIVKLELVTGNPPHSRLFVGAEVANPRNLPDGEGAMVSVRPRRASAERSLLAQQDLLDEMQSRNEELETVNEELQSLNDQMSAMEEEMRRLDAESRRANDFLRLMLDTAGNSFIACDGDNRVLFWNKAATKHFHLSSAQAVGRDLFKVVPALGDAKMRAAAQKARSAGRGGQSVVRKGRLEYVFKPLSSGGGKSRSYLLRVRAATS